MLEDRLRNIECELNHLDSRLSFIYNLNLGLLPAEGQRELMEMEREYMDLLDEQAKLMDIPPGEYKR